MSWANPFANDDKLIKKSDDLLPKAHLQPMAWQPRPIQILRKRRVVYLVCAFLAIYLFIKNLPTDIGPHPRWADARVYRGPLKDGKVPAPSSGASSKVNTPSPPTKKPPRPPSASASEEHYHDGPIKFYKLAASLHAVAKLGGQKDLNKNVLFAASSLKSVSELLPMACEMALWARNDVHLAIMGRDDMELAQIKELNGMDEDCNVHWHDARPDFSKWSTDYRMESSVAASLEHIQTFIHPQVILIDDAKREDTFFVDAAREKSIEILKPLIELPSNAMESLMWLAHLDSASLASWPRTTIDIVVQAPARSSGSLVRLLKSIENADYFGARRPHLTIELPAEVDEPTTQYLSRFVWPPVDWSGRPQTSQLTLRHRIPRLTTSPEEASSRLVESFWPKSRESHVLVLSPQVELSPLYYHYLFYSVLEYRHSRLARSNEKYSSLMGVSLHVPDMLLDDVTKLVPPTSKKAKLDKDTNAGSRVPFLWQAPNNEAALYFGDTWREFHSFLSLRLTKPPSQTPKVINKTRPAWMESLLEFMRARGYSLLYPGAYFDDFTLSTVHDELFQVPEEYLKDTDPTTSPKIDSSTNQILEGNATRVRNPPPNTEKTLLETSLLDYLPNKGNLLELDKVSIVSFEGDPLSFKDVGGDATRFAENFRQTTGGCSAGQRAPQYRFGHAVDLFCDPNEPFDYQALSAAQPVKIQAPNAGGEKPLSDPDQISPGQAGQAASENAQHLNRQATRDAAQTRNPTSAPENNYDEKVSVRSGETKKPSTADKKASADANGSENGQNRFAKGSNGIKATDDAPPRPIMRAEQQKIEVMGDSSGEAALAKAAFNKKPKTPASKEPVKEQVGDDEDDDQDRMPGW